MRVEREKKIREDAVNSVDREISELTRKISHDLKAPIRSMQGFSQAVTDDYADKLDPAALDYLQRIRRASERMDNLINELVIYARLSSKTPVYEAIDCVNFISKHVIPQIVTELPRDVTIKSSGAIPVVYADKSLLTYVMKEVVINSATYVTPETKPIMTISGQINQKNTIIRIKDNGIGVDPGQKDSVFNIFTRLHGVEQYPGLGIGLAIAKRGMNIMKGDITLQSDGISGTTIIFTFPKPGSIEK
jgi:signal transduction histidine kinase